MIRELPEGKPALNLFRLKVDSSEIFFSGKLNPKMGFAHLPYGGKVSFIAKQKFHELKNLTFRLMTLHQTFSRFIVYFPGIRRTALRSALLQGRC